MRKQLYFNPSTETKKAYLTRAAALLDIIRNHPGLIGSHPLLTGMTDAEMKEFENYLWEQVLKSMKSTVDVFKEEEGSSAKQTVDYFMDTAISDVSKSLTDQNMGPGSLAQQMYEQMKRTNTVNVEDLFKENKTEE